MNTGTPHPETNEFALIFADIQARYPAFRPDLLLDVGANVGQSSRVFADLFPNARILAFEPVPAAYAQLKEAVAHKPLIETHGLALGARRGRLTMTARGASTVNHVVPRPAEVEEPTVEVPVETGAAICRAERIDRIAYLKIDTEGHDLEVVRGFGLAIRRADFVQLEVGMNAYNRTHVPFGVMDRAMRRRGFLLFRLYDQTFEFKREGRPVLRRANPVYINASLVDLAGIG